MNTVLGEVTSGSVEGVTTGTFVVLTVAKRAKRRLLICVTKKKNTHQLEILTRHKY